MLKNKQNSQHSTLNTQHSRGVSVISVIITVIVIILLASITIFSGSNMLRQAREDRAYDRLEVIYQAVRANEAILGIGDSIEETKLTNNNYVQIGLDYFLKDNDLPDIYYEKNIGGINDITSIAKRTYVMREKDGDKTKYEKSFEYDLTSTTYSTAIDFDVVAGVNRPQLTSDMKAINYANSGEMEYVEDIFLSQWYSYDSSAPNYANMEIDISGTKHYYVWIPRYAYKIQDYYKDNIMPTIPESAIDIIFLKGTTNLDANDNLIPSGYTVHPAFIYGDTALTGIWIEKNATLTSYSIGDVYSEALSLYNVEDIAESHLLKNVEWSAMAYLSQTCGASKSTISSTGNNSGIKNINDGIVEYTSCYINDSSDVLATNGASLKNGVIVTKNIYVSPGTWSTINTVNPVVLGDALVETSSGNGDTSAWYNSKTIQPRPDTPFITRNTGDSVFGFSSSNGAEDEAYYRTAIKVVGLMADSIVISDTDAKYVKVAGDTYLYEPSLTGFNIDNTYYVTWSGTNDATESILPITSSAPADWYNYTNHKWANILVKNGGNKAYFVWIPRYVYKLDDSVSGLEVSDVRFVDINNRYKNPDGTVEELTIGEGEDEWRLPVAFTWDGVPIQGYWMSKYQISKMDNFYVERYPNKIIIKSIDAANDILGTGTYSFYKGAVYDGQKAYSDTLTYTYDGLQPNYIYKIRIVGSNGAEMERNVRTIGNIPKIQDSTSVITKYTIDTSGFDTSKTFYVTWDSAGNEVHTPLTMQPPNGWFDYTNKKWANIMVEENGGKLYLVWIPRFKYKLQYADEVYDDFINGDTGFGYSNVIFLTADSSLKAGQTDNLGYAVPQAFNWNGVELPGFWMTKYQISMKDNFYVERGTNYICIRTIPAETKQYLGTSGNYTYYLNGVEKGTVANDKSFMIDGLEESTTYTVKVHGVITGKEITRQISTLDKTKMIKESDSTGGTGFCAPVLTGFEAYKENTVGDNTLVTQTYYVTWDSSGNEYKRRIDNGPPSGWYDYSNKKWANILVETGDYKAYFVWIPRYKYKLNSDTKQLLKSGDNYIESYDSSLYGYSQVIFISQNEGTAGEAYGNYFIPKAFSFEDVNGNTVELPGFWMSKYQVSAELGLINW